MVKYAIGWVLGVASIVALARLIQWLRLDNDLNMLIREAYRWSDEAKA